jgi:nucleoside-diphosphate-sugar epimerase
VKVLVTGATGFIGRHLCSRLLAEGFSVRATHRRSAAPDDTRIDWRRLERMDDAELWQEPLAGVSAVVHLAALAHQVGVAGVGRWEEFARTNVTATAALARACARAHTGRLVFLSSIAASCSASTRAIDASLPAAPESDYGRSKLEAEQAIDRELRSSTVDWCVLRPPLVYGPGNPGNMERLLKLLATGLPLPFGAIRNRRSFIYVHNLTDAILRVLNHRDTIRATFVVGDGSDFSTPALVAALAAATGRHARIFRVPESWLRLLGRGGDFAAKVLRRGVPIDSYSVSKLTESLFVDGAAFAEKFDWRASIAPADALQATCGEIAAGEMQ